MFAFFCHLISNIHASVTKNTARHVQLNVWTKVYAIESSSFEFVSRAFFSVLVAQVLEMTFTSLVADGTIKRMIKQQKFHHTISGVDNFFAGDVFHDHAIHYI